MNRREFATGLAAAAVAIAPVGAVPLLEGAPIQEPVHIGVDLGSESWSHTAIRFERKKVCGEWCWMPAEIVEVRNEII